jgi:phosphatidylinositol-3-phosphatase
VVPIGKDDERLGGPRASCESCGTELARDQRYCLGCGTRQGPVPPAFARWLSIVRPKADEAEAASEVASVDDDAGAAGAPEEDGEETLAERFMPEPRSAAIAVMALLAFGVVIGAATGPIARSAGISPLIVEMSSPPPVEETAPEAIAEAPAEVVESAPEATPSALPPEPAAPEETGTTTPTKTTPPPEKFEEGGLPTIEHVFLIVLGDHGFEEGFGPSSPAPYLAQTLRAKGELLSNYFAVTKGDLANEIALLSGQGPTQATAAECPSRTDIAPATVAGEEQVTGEGCVYPAATQTLPGQLAAAKKSWKVYTEDAEGPAPEAVAGCGPYATSGNPVAYFHSLIDSPECGEHDVGLTQLEADLGSEKTAPALSYVVPNACHDGAEAPCEPGRPDGLAATEPFLEKVVPEIEASMAYKKSGLIAITFAQAPQSGANADSTACCGTPEFPNLPQGGPATAVSGPVKPSGGGGRVGLLLISPFIEAGSVNEAGYYNHFSLLLSIEEAFGLTPIGYAANPALSAFDSTVYNQGG